MAFFSWIFLTAATAVAILVGRWLAKSSTKTQQKLNFDRSVFIGLAAGGGLAILGGLTSGTALYGFSFGAAGLVLMAVFGGIIGFVTTVVVAWAMFQPWTSGVRNRLNDGSWPRRKMNRQQNPWLNQQYRSNQQYPTRPKNPPTNQANPKKQHPWQ